MSKSLAIQAINIHKEYTLNKQKTFKEFLPALFGGKAIKEHFYALKGVNFILNRGESLGILGTNGSGKSTLLKLIAGVTKPSDGMIEVRGMVFPLIELGAGFHPELTGKENVYLNASILGIRKKEVDDLYQSIVDFSQLADFMNQPVKHYSSGMYMRLAFAVAVAKTPDILLVDEILAVGDSKFQHKCLKRIKEFQEQGTTMIMVSHDMNKLTAYCQYGMWLDKGKQKFYGKIDQAIKQYQDFSQ